RELFDLLTLEGLLHVVGPHLNGERTTGDLTATAEGADRHGLSVDLAIEHDRGGEVRCVTGEPCGLVLVRRTGLAGGRTTEVLGVAARTTLNDLAQGVRGLGTNCLV